MHFKLMRIDSLLGCFLEKQLSKISTVSKIMQYHSPAILVIRRCPKLFFEKILSCPLILEENTVGNLLSSSSLLIYAITPAIKTERITRPRRRYAVRTKSREKGKRMKIQKMGQGVRKRANKDGGGKRESREGRVAWSFALFETGNRKKG